MNIYIIPAWYPQNETDIAASFFREQAHALAAYGHDVTVIHIEPVSVLQIFKQPIHQRREWIDGDVRTFFHKVIVPIPGKFTRLQDLFISRLFLTLIRKQIKADFAAGRSAPDLLHAHVSHSCGYYCLTTAKQLNLPLVVTEHYSGLVQGTATAREYERVRQTILRSDSFIFVGSNFQKLICHRLKIQKSTHVIGNLLPDRFFQSVSKTQSETFTFLCACHLKANKGVDYVIRAFHETFPQMSNVQLRIAGDGEMYVTLKQLAAELREDDRIYFFGKYSREDAPKLFSESDAFVLTSRVETFGIVYLEAMSAGLPCIGTQGQGADDIITEESGFLVEYGQLEQLSDAMRIIYQNRKSYDTSTIQEECRQKFSASAICRQLETVYKELKR